MFLGCVPVSQKPTSDGRRCFHVLTARRVEGGEVIQVYFDVTELLAAEQRALGL
jgi:hypothetical protein